MTVTTRLKWADRVLGLFAAFSAPEANARITERLRDNELRPDADAEVLAVAVARALGMSAKDARNLVKAARDMQAHRKLTADEC
jgi:hypothetical protein